MNNFTWKNIKTFMDDKEHVKKFVFDDCAEQLCNLLKILLRVPMQEPVLVKETVQHASINFLLLDHLGLAEVLHGDNQLLNSDVNLVRWR